jgi:MFS family permease
MLIGATFGAVQVAVPAAADEAGAQGASGVLLALLSVGALLGAFFYGSRAWSAAPAGRLVALLLIITTALVLLSPASGLVFVGVMLLFAGAPLAPAITTVSLLVDEHAPSHLAAEAFGWISLGTAAGLAPGNALAGVLVEESGPRAGFALAATIGASAALVAALGYGRLSSSFARDS